ncbi:hypothetical protein D3C76_1639290 [compost metagenome]
MASDALGDYDGLAVYGAARIGGRSVGRDARGPGRAQEADGFLRSRAIRGASGFRLRDGDLAGVRPVDRQGDLGRDLLAGEERENQRDRSA